MYGGYDVYQTCPSGQPYTIRAGDTYTHWQYASIPLSCYYGSKSGVDPNRLMIGQRICIPVTPMPGECQRVLSRNINSGR